MVELSQRGSRRAWVLAALAPALLVALVYGPACLHAGFIADDVWLLANHAHPGGVLGEWTHATHPYATGEPGGYVWRPLVASAHQIIGELFGRQPPPFRVFNALLHALNGALLVLCARRLGAAPPAGAALACAFVVHPAVPDAVCWASSTYDLASAGLMLGAMLVALAERPRLALRAALVGLLTLAALLCKEPAIGFVGALPLALFLIGPWRRAAAIGLSMALAAGLHALLHRAVVGPTQKGLLDMVSPADLAGVITDYTTWLFAPIEAGFTHLVSPGHEPLRVGGLAILTLAAVGGWLGRRRFGGLALLAGTLSFLALTVPAAAAALSIGQQASRYLYLPICLLFAWLGGLRAPGNAIGRLGPALPLALGLLWLPRTVGRVAEWRTEGALFVAEHRAEPENPVSSYVLGRMLVGAGKAEAGLPLWRWAVDHPVPFPLLYDQQRERLDYAVAAADAGRREESAAVLADFLAEEQASGRPIDPSVLALSQRLAAPPR